jgi:hypothetical protein
MFKKPPHLNEDIFKKQQKPLNQPKTHGDVWQDNNTVSRVRGERDQAVMFGDTPRTPRMNNGKHRSQKPPSNKDCIKSRSGHKSP